jgi:hypothetical protein
MRRVTESERDRGAATVLLIGAMTVVLIAGAFAIDVGRYVVEARSAQNSADATVLAVATDCARTGSPIADYSPYRKTRQTITDPTCGNGEATIAVGTPITDGLLLRRTVGSVTRTATAAWATLGRATTVPLIVSDCEFSEALLDGAADIVLYLDDPKPSSGCSSLPGGFSQLLSDGCEVTVTAGDVAVGAPGADLQKIVECITNPSAPALPHEILIALYDATACEALDCKGRGPYPVLGFAVFRVTGYSLIGNFFGGTLGRTCPDETRGRYCIRGDFIRSVTSQGTPGPSTDFGTYNVHLTR